MSTLAYSHSSSNKLFIQFYIDKLIIIFMIFRQLNYFYFHFLPIIELFIFKLYLDSLDSDGFIGFYNDYFCFIVNKYNLKNVKYL